MHIEKIEKKTVVELVMDRMKELMVTGHFKVGDQIPTEKELAETFGIGRSTIREAIKLFNYLGILKSQPGVGTIVCDRTSISTEALTWSILLGKADMFEMLELRRVLEERGLSAIADFHRLHSEEFKQIIEGLEYETGNMRTAVEKSSVTDLIRADYSFHERIISASKVSLFRSIYETLRSFTREEMQKSMRPDLSDVVKEHVLYMDTIKTGNLERMKSVLDAHMEDVKKDLS
jgi:GntR family transcriptional regulator, transcriptional repressor for pyruvate dehydrogenase complex